jgi:hypothetical protein
MGACCAWDMGGGTNVARTDDDGHGGWVGVAYLQAGDGRVGRLAIPDGETGVSGEGEGGEGGAGPHQLLQTTAALPA